MSVIATVLKTVIEYRLWDFKSLLVLAVSGGRDSMVLLDIMHRLAPSPGEQLIVAHIDHGARTGSEKDAAFVETVCRHAGLPCVCISLDTRHNPRDKRDSRETEWRRKRYAALQAIRRESGASAVATGHTATDHLETVLMRLTAGSGPRGFLGIRTKRDDHIIRPLMDVTRPEVTNYAQAQGIQWRDDPTNSDTVHPRNRIRASVIPILREINPRAEQAAVRVSRMLAREDTAISRWAHRVLKDAGWRHRLPAILQADVFAGEPDAVVNRCSAALYDALTPASGYRVTSDHILRLAGCLAGHRDGSPLPAGARAVYRNGQIVLLPHVPDSQMRRVIELNTIGDWTIGAYDISVTRVERIDDHLPILTGNNLSVRTRRPGDRWMPHKSGSPVRLSEHFRTRKVPAEIRDSLPLIADASAGVQWIAGPVSDSEVYIIPAQECRFKLTCRPRSAIRWSMSSGNNDPSV